MLRKIFRFQSLFDFPIVISRNFLNTTPSAVQNTRSRLFYQSKKRGILENDILIGGFAEENLQKMSPDELTKYDEIINGKHMEWDLYYYFTGKKEPPSDLNENPIFARMCTYVNSKGRH